MRHFSGEFTGLRLLMEDELELIAGGDGEDGDELPEPAKLPEIIVKATADKTVFYIPNPAIWAVGGSTVETPEPKDEAAIHIDVNIQRPLTAEEEQLIKELAKSIQKANEAINAIPDKAKVTLPNGKSVSGQELKEVWKNTDFVINDNGFKYKNGTDRGEADYNNGNPIVSFNMSLVKSYGDSEAAMNFLPFHELAHMTSAGRDQNAAFVSGKSTNDQNERLANDIARAIANYSGVPILSDPGGGYTPEAPVFK